MINNLIYFLTIFFVLFIPCSHSQISIENDNLLKQEITDHAKEISIETQTLIKEVIEALESISGELSWGEVGTKEFSQIASGDADGLQAELINLEDDANDGIEDIILDLEEENIVTPDQAKKIRESAKKIFLSSSNQYLSLFKNSIPILFELLEHSKNISEPFSEENKLILTSIDTLHSYLSSTFNYSAKKTIESSN